MDMDSPVFSRLARTIDDLTTLDLTGVGLAKALYEARLKHQPGPMCLSAARLITERVRAQAGPALIITGFPEGGGVPETDGPVGAAMLARALLLSMNVRSVILTDENWVACVRGACRGAGLVPMALPESGRVEEIELLRYVYVAGVPKDWDACRQVGNQLLERLQPTLMVAIERPGMGEHGVYHGMSGRVLNDLVADLDTVVRRGQDQGIPLLAFGDGGNELGMGVLHAELPKLHPKAADCGCPCHGGIGAATAADNLVVAGVSNWGVTGVIAALALLLEDPNVMHDPEHEIRSIEYCVANGAVDGLSMSPESAVDGISVREWDGLIRAMKGIVTRGLGLNRDWRQVK